jgi:hypothetical protein
VTIASAEQQPASLAVDETRVYWTIGGGVAFDCPVAGCPDNTPTLLTLHAAQSAGSGMEEEIAAGSSTAFLIDDSSNLDSCAADGCSLMPTLYFGTLDGGDAVTSSIRSILSDSSTLYFTDGESIYSCPVASTCSSPSVLLVKTSAFIGYLAVSAGEVFYVDGASYPMRLRAVPVAGGGRPRVVCKDTPLNALSGVTALVASGGYVYLTTSNDPTSIYSCPTSASDADLAVFARGDGLYGLAADETSLYWAEGSGVIGVCPLGPSCMGGRAVASSQNGPQLVAVNSTAVFWTTSTGIFSAAK